MPGHVYQNLYLACEAIGAGTCAIAKYDQDFADKVLGIEGVAVTFTGKLIWSE